MNLLTQLLAWVEPLFRRPPPLADMTERLRQQEERRREDEQSLRQLRAELELMRRWRSTGEHGQ
jgi:hypothetical protein